MSDQTVIAVLAQTDGTCSICGAEYRKGVSVLAPTEGDGMAHFHCVHPPEDEA